MVPSAMTNMLRSLDKRVITSRAMPSPRLLRSAAPGVQSVKGSTASEARRGGAGSGRGVAGEAGATTRLAAGKRLA